MARRVKKAGGKSPRQAREARGEGMRGLLQELAGESRRARAMSEVEAFRAVPTEILSFNRASAVGGAPLSCVWLVHGPEGGGKTAFVCALMKAVQRVGGIAAFVDAEMSADTKRWFPKLGVDTASCLYIGRTGEGAEKVPLTYEETVEECDGLVTRYQKMKKAKAIPPGTPMLVAVDSISKLCPKDVMSKVSARGPGKGGEVLRSGIGRIQAMMNRGWLATLSPRIGDDDLMFLVIAHEFEEEQYEQARVKGGKGIKYDAMMQCRVQFAQKVTDSSAKEAPMTGKKHRVRLLKNKHGPAWREAVFYTANGKGVCPMGFDHVRETIHEAFKVGLIEGGGEEGGRKALELYAGTRVGWDGKTRKLSSFYDAEDQESQAVLAGIRAALAEEPA